MLRAGGVGVGVVALGETIPLPGLQRLQLEEDSGRAGLFWALAGGEPSGTLVSLNTFLTPSKEWGFLSQNYSRTGLRACQREA